eukprot:scaffold1117_cov379-Prasinococcus_capsulatus_cf.AAC.17
MSPAVWTHSHGTNLSLAARRGSGQFACTRASGSGTGRRVRHGTTPTHPVTTTLTSTGLSSHSYQHDNKQSRAESYLWQHLQPGHSVEVVRRLAAAPTMA